MLLHSLGGRAEMSAAVEAAGQSVLDRQERDWELGIIGKTDLVGLSELELRSVSEKRLALGMLEEVNVL
jgi:hypothetical protein